MLKASDEMEGSLQLVSMLLKLMTISNLWTVVKIMSLIDIGGDTLTTIIIYLSRRNKM